MASLTNLNLTPEPRFWHTPTMTHHTKGPWSIYVSDVLGSVEVGAKQEPFCHLTRHSKEQTDRREANAHLIAAAPEMYALLQDLLDAHYAGRDEDFMDWAIYRNAKLLKKARGEQ